MYKNYVRFFFLYICIFIKTLRICELWLLRFCWVYNRNFEFYIRNIRLVRGLVVVGYGLCTEKNGIDTFV